MKYYNIDDAVIGSLECDYNYENKKFFIRDKFNALSIKKLQEKINKICLQHDFDKDGTMKLATCEGFNSEFNLKIISQILQSHYGTSYMGKVIFDNGSLTFHKKSIKQFGIWVVPNAAFTYGELKTQYFGKKGILFDQCVPEINYNRKLNKTFCTLYARRAYDRSRIFDHMVRNYYDDGNYIYRDFHVDYSDLPYYKSENHINQKYNNVYTNVDAQYSAENTAKYILDDIGIRASECFLNIVSETNYYENNSCWFTEKTVTSMLSGFPFITSSSVGYYDILKDLGFRTFSNFWDESFNNIKNHEQRTDALLNNIDEIAKRFNTRESKISALEKMKPILEHNRQRWHDIWSCKDEKYLEPFGYNEILRIISSSVQDSPY
jgi:hypothetical protein